VVVGIQEMYFTEGRAQDFDKGYKKAWAALVRVLLRSCWLAMNSWIWIKSRCYSLLRF